MEYLLIAFTLWKESPLLKALNKGPQEMQVMERTAKAMQIVGRYDSAYRCEAVKNHLIVLDLKMLREQPRYYECLRMEKTQ